MTFKTKLTVGISAVFALLGGSFLMAQAPPPYDIYVSNQEDCPPLETCYSTIQEAVTVANPGESILVFPGVYVENIVITERVILHGAQAGNSGCLRETPPQEETIITGTGRLLELQARSAGTIIDGFTFEGANTSIESTTGSLDNLEIRNNIMRGFERAGVFLNDSGSNVTAEGNLVDGYNQSGAGGIFHLDTDLFHGFRFEMNCVTNGATGLFVDGNRNVSDASGRTPAIRSNRFWGNGTGVNLGRMAFENGEIANNEFVNNEYDGLQGGMKNCTITQNVFQGNGRTGLALTGFGGAGDPDRGAQDNTIANNCFGYNGAIHHGEAILFSDSQDPLTISTNSVADNNIYGNLVGASYGGLELITISGNWWGSVNGPSVIGPGSGDAVVGNFLVGSFESSPVVDTPCPFVPCYSVTDLHAYDRRKAGRDKVEFKKAGFDAAIPGPDETIALVMNDLLLAEVRFDEGRLDKDEWVYKSPKKVKPEVEIHLNFGKCQWRAEVDKTELGLVDYSIPVSFELHVGDEFGFEKVMMDRHGKEEWRYEALNPVECCTDSPPPVRSGRSLHRQRGLNRQE